MEAMQEEAERRPAGEPIRALEVLSRAWALYKGNLALFVGIGAVGQVLGAVTNILLASGVALLWWTGHSLFLPGLVVYFWAGAASIIAASNSYLQQQITLRDSFAKVEGKYLNYAVTSVLYFLIFTAGFYLLVVPGVYAVTILWLAPVAAVLEAGRESGFFRRSRQLIRGSFWRVLKIQLFLLALMLAAALLSVAWGELHSPTDWLWLRVFQMFYLPFAAVVQTVLYHRLSGQERLEEGPPKEVPPGRKPFGCLLALLCAAGLIVANVLLAIGWVVILKRIMGG